MEIWILIAYLLAVIFVLFSLTFYLYYYSQSLDCQADPNFWCWNDWTCASVQPGTGRTDKPAQDIYGCKPNVVRDENYCTNYTGSPPPGCQCMPNADGTFPDACKYFFTTQNLGNCSTLLAGTTDSTWPSLHKCASNLTG
jgi:hypothetical protein